MKLLCAGVCSFLLSTVCFAQKPIPKPAPAPVYVVLWFDTEDYIEPAADDAALRIATELTDAGVRATFKLVGEKARVLEARGRTDVIRALSLHAIGYHTNFHSVPPAPAVYLKEFGLMDGAREFVRREMPGVDDIRRIFGVTPICYGQPGSSWAPQTSIGLREMGIPVYLDGGTHVGIDDQPIWYNGILYAYNMGRFQVRPKFDEEDALSGSLRKFDAAVAELRRSGGGLISTYFHPTEFVTTEFWDAVNFPQGASRERADWVKPHRRTPEAAERCFRILREYVEHALKTPGVRFVTAGDLLQLYESPVPPKLSRQEVAAHLSGEITFLRTPSGNLSPADLLLELLEMEPAIVDGPDRQGKTTYSESTIPRPLFDRVKKDTAGFIQANHRLPAEVFMGTYTLSLEDFAATAAGEQDGSGPVTVRRGHLATGAYFAQDPAVPFGWPIHPKGFSAPELMEMARLQGWTLKPARLR
jgi:hypothetical protein